jgi:predicted metal-dependent peptidase
MIPADPQTAARVLALCEADRSAWLARYPFLAHLGLRLDVVPTADPRLPTAATDGAQVFVDAGFMLGLTPEERRFVLAHEIWHCALGHLARRGGREALRWNVAADHEVNALLAEEGFAVPDDCVLIRQWRGRSAEEVYDLLPGRFDPLPGRGRLADLHDVPGLAIRDQDGTWRVALATAARVAGTLPGGLRLVLERLLPPTLPWESLLAQFLGRAGAARRAWDRPSRRSAALGMHLPGWRRSGPRLAVAIDASGSCLQVLPRFLGELEGAAAAVDATELRVIVFDAAVQTDVRLTLGEINGFARGRIRGGGGTDFHPPLAALATEELDAAVVLTDGFGRVPRAAPGFPVLWVLTPDGEAPVEWARTIRMPRRSLPSAAAFPVAAV